MDEITIDVAKDFTRYPGGRYRAKGDWTGEEFRDDRLLPALESGAHITVNMNNLFTILPSFLDEAFGNIVEKIGLEEFQRRITIILTDDPDSSAELADIYSKRNRAYLKQKRIGK